MPKVKTIVVLASAAAGIAALTSAVSAQRPPTADERLLRLETSVGIDVRRYGARGDGTNDDTAAIDAALDAAAGGSTVLLPGSASVYTHRGTIALKKGITLEGAGAKGYTSGVVLKINAGTEPAIRIEDGPVHLRNLTIRNDGGSGFGIHATRQIIADSVDVARFKRANLLLEHDTNQVGPYGSIFRNCGFYYSEDHGAVVGNGANLVMFISSDFKWNGWKGTVAPRDPRKYQGEDRARSLAKDGLFVGTRYNPYRVPVYNPEGLTILAGDSSYNSRYGWNIDGLAVSSSVFPGYAEWNGNYTADMKPAQFAQYQARIGNDLVSSLISFGTLKPEKILADAAYSASSEPSLVLAGGRIIGQNGATQPREWWNLAGLRIFLSAAREASVSVVPDNSNGDARIAPAGNARLRLGGQDEVALTISNRGVQLPLSYSQGDETRTYSRTVALGPPERGKHGVGDIVFNSEPADGRPLGWVCVAAGAPGIWRPFAQIGR